MRNRVTMFLEAAPVVGDLASTRNEVSGRNVGAVVADRETDARRARGTVGCVENLTDQVEQIQELLTEHEGGLARGNLVRAREVVRLGLLMIACLEANPELKKKDLAGRIGKHAAWVTRFTKAARLADDPERITGDQARAILLKAHGNMQRAARPGRVFTSQSLVARIMRAVRDALRFGMPALEIRVSVEGALSGAELPELRPYAKPEEDWRS